MIVGFFEGAHARLAARWSPDERRAAAETSDVWNGYMDGAVRSGHRAATEILDRFDS